MANSSELYVRAAAIFGSNANGVRWPYGASGGDESLRRTNPEQYRWQLVDRDRRRHSIVDWAERHGLKASTVKCCPWWLSRKISRQCDPGVCDWNSDDGLWLDHRICWLKDRKPAVISSAPFRISPESSARITWWLAQQPNLRTVQGEGWYGFGTIQILMWRADRIATVEPATGAP